jgi:hypothetical protein
MRGISRMAAALLVGEHDCPHWMIVLPKPHESAAKRAVEWFKPAHWTKRTVIVCFVCPVTMTAVGEGFEVCTAGLDCHTYLAFHTCFTLHTSPYSPCFRHTRHTRHLAIPAIFAAL